MRKTYVFRKDENGELQCYDINEAPPLELELKRHSGVIEDTMPLTLNHADGRMYDSKAAFRRATKAAGCIEVGNDYKRDDRGNYQPLTRRPQMDSIKSDIIRAYKESRGE